MGRGFLGLHDNAPAKALTERLAQPRVMYATEDVLKVIGDGIMQ
jgi:hypothetical protein